MMGLPTLNAVLNGTSAVLLSFGYFFIKRNNVAAHRRCMKAAFTTSSIFLVSYLYYHAHIGSKHFQGTGWSRPLYFSILITHTILAAVIVPMVLTSLWKAWKQDFVGHKRIAQWTWPLW